MPKLERGRIVWVELPGSEKPVAVVAVTTKFSEPLPPDHVRLPWHRDGKVRTQLRKPEAAVCSWLRKITERDVVQVGGVVPPKEMIEVLKIVGANVAKD